MTIIYFIKCFVSMGIAWSIYKLLLADKKSFLFNRGFLMASIVGLAFVPFISLPSSVVPVVEPILPQFENLATYAVEFNETPVEVIAPIATEGSSRTIFQWIWLFYIVGFVLLLRTIFNIAKLSIAAHKNLHHSDGQIQVIDSNYENTPFSFFNNLFLSSEQMEEGLPEEVLAHELCHINHFHSIDRIVVELILLMQWWNPFAHLLIRSLKENHEYTADNYALRSKGQSNRLIEQIISYSTKANSNHLFQIGFAQSSILKRIKMIKNKKRSLLPVVGACSVILILFVAISCTDIVDELDAEKHKDEPTFTLIEFGEMEYVYPVSLLENFKRGELSTGLIPEYKSPTKELYKKFNSDEKFKIFVDEKEVVDSQRKTLELELIKAFYVNYSFDITMTLHEVYLYTHEGYFNLAARRIKGMKENAIGIGDEGGLFIFPKFVRKNGSESYQALPPEVKRPSLSLLNEIFLSDDYKVLLDGKPVDDKNMLSRDPNNYFFFLKSKSNNVSALSQDPKSNHYYLKSKKRNITTVGLFTKEGYSALLDRHKKLKAPELSIRLN